MIKKILTRIKKKIKILNQSKKDPGSLFDGDDAIFKSVAKKSLFYGEYGCGASTLWLDGNADLRIKGVDSSKDWIDFVLNKVGRSTDIDLIWIDFGPLGKWGRPISYEKDHNIINYLEYIWRGEDKPDLVLIDGRFRVACFLTSLLHSNEGALIIFYYYRHRAHYHIVERFLKPTEYCGRQALFMVPSSAELDYSQIREMRDKFIYVMD